MSHVNDSQNTARRPSWHTRTRQAPRPHQGRVRADQKNPWSRTELYRAGNFFRHVERTLLVQKFEERAEEISDGGPKYFGQGRRRKRGSSGYRRWPGSRVQDGEPQPPKVPRASPRPSSRARRKQT